MSNILTYVPTFISLTLNSGYIAIYDDTGARQYYQNTDGVIELPYAATGTWSYRITKYGYTTITGVFVVDRNVGGTVSIIPVYIPDAFVTSDVYTVTAYNDLNSIQKLYNYISYYKTTSTGIDFGDITTRSFGYITINNNLTLNGDLSSSLFTYSTGGLSARCSSLDETVTINVSGNFYEINNNTISDGVTIRANNIDSELFFNGTYSIVFFPTVTDRDNNTNGNISFTGSTYRYKYGSTVSGINFTSYIYYRVTIGGSIFLIQSAIQPGKTTIDFSVNGNLQIIINNQRVINTGVQKSSKLIPHNTNI